MKKILVTGAGGLVGYQAAKALRDSGKYEVFSTCHGDLIPEWENTLQTDLTCTDLGDLGIEFDQIVHCAAKIPNHIHGDKQAASDNRRIDDNIINYCAKKKCRLIYISSTAVYRNDNRNFLTEQSELNLDSKYKYEKRQSEIKIESKCDSYLIFRITSPYGSRQQNRTVLKNFVTAACAGKDLYYFGSGERTQNFIHVSDIALAVLKSTASKKIGTVNLASANSISMKRLAELVADLAKNRLNVSPKVLSGKNADPQEEVRTNIDIHLAEQMLGWKPLIDIKTGICNWIEDFVC